MPKRDREKSITLWFDPENTEHRRVLEIFDHFVNELKNRKQNAGMSLTALRMQVVIMMANSLAKAKKPDLFLPQEQSDVLLQRLIIAIHEMSEELTEVQRKIANGIPLSYGDLNSAQRARDIAGQYGAFEKSAASSMTTFEINYDDE